MIGIGVINDLHLGAADPGRKACPRAARLVQPQAGRSDQIDAVADGTAQTAARPLHHFAKQFGKHPARAPGIGIGQCRALRRPHTQVIQPGGVARQASDDLAQARRSGKLAIEQCHELAFRVPPANSRISAVCTDQPVEHIPRYVLQQPMKNVILMAHGIDPQPRVRNVAQRPRPSGFNAMLLVYKNSTGQPWPSPSR